MGAEAIVYALIECDAVAVVTTKNLLSTVSAAIKDCPSIKTIIYFSELHQHPDADLNATATDSQNITNSGRKLVSFESLLNIGLESCKFYIVLKV